jgi:hypothetical protein
MTSEADGRDHATLRQIFYLLTFSPANGIGFYETDDSLYVLDLLAAQDLRVEADVAGYILTLIGHQLEAGLAFDSKKAMLDFMHREYLRDKKNNYYAELLTTRMDPSRQLQMLTFLNDDKLRPVQVSRAFVQVMKNLWEPDVAASVMRAVMEFKLSNVQECLQNDFQHITSELKRLTSYNRPPRLKG